MDLYKKLEETNKLLTSEKAKREELQRRELDAYRSVPEGTKSIDSLEVFEAHRDYVLNHNQIRVLKEQKERLENAIRVSILNNTREWNVKTHGVETEHLRDRRSKGLFGRMGLWFKRHFSSSYNQPQEVEPVQVEEVTHSSRFLIEEERIEMLRRDDSFMESRAEMEYQEEKKVMADAYDGKRPATFRLDTDGVDVDYNKMRTLFIENEWSQKGQTAPKLYEDEEQRENQFKSQVDMFLREIGVPNYQAQYQSAKQTGKIHYIQRVKPIGDVMELLEHRDEAHAKEFMKDVLNFSITGLYETYPLHLMSAKDRLAAYPKLEEMSYRLNAQCQFAQKYIYQFISPELRKRLDEASFDISLLGELHRSIGNKSDSYMEFYQKVICKRDETLAYGEYAEDYKKIKTLMQEGGNGIAIENTILSDTITIEDVKSYAQELINYKLVTKTGRPRLIGNEPAEIVRKFAADDIAFYSGLKNKGKLVSEYMKNHRAKCKEELPDISRDTIDAYVMEVLTLLNALGHRLNSGTAISHKSVETLAGTRENRYWYLEKMNSDAEAMNLTKVGFEGQEPEFTDEMLEERDRVLKIVGPKPNALYAAYNRVKEKIKNKEDLSTPEKAVLDICKLYVTLVNGPADMYKRLRAKIGDNFGAEEIKLAIEICDHEMSQSNAIRDNEEYIEKHHLDRRVMSAYAPCYRVKADGTPDGPENERKKQGATEFILKYQEDKDFRINFVKSTIEENLAMTYTMDMFTNEYISNHFAELRIIADQNTVIDNLIKDQRNKEYFSKLTEEEISNLLDITSGLGTVIGHILKAYSCRHSFIAGNGMEFFDKDRQEVFVNNTTSKDVEVIMTEMASVLERRKQGFKLPDVD